MMITEAVERLGFTEVVQTLQEHESLLRKGVC